MKWLLWREYRLNRLIRIVGAVLLVLPYVFVLIGLVALSWASEPPSIGVPSPPPAIVAFGGAAFYSIFLSLLTLTFLGGNAFAGERADRSAEYLAYLPLSRLRRLAAKLALALGTAVSIWGFNILVLLVLYFVLLVTPSEVPSVRPDDVLGPAGLFVVTGLVMFSVAWLVSSLQSSPAFAVCSGLISPWLLVIGLQAAAWIYDPLRFGLIVAVGYAVTCPVLAVVCFSIGTWYYLRRVEP
ncbi:MAG TPA: hypothetical protein VMY37_12465 [Thermoguttaceae bacterium]|nr:hypothetical protein [Thermoguttaceae bacterium]